MPSVEYRGTTWLKSSVLVYCDVAMNGITMTPSRADEMVFSPPYVDQTLRFECEARLDVIGDFVYKLVSFLLPKVLSSK